MMTCPKNRQSKSNLSDDVKAVIDVGSNSIKLRVGKVEGGKFQTLLDTTEAVRIGRGIESGFIKEEALQDGVDVIDRLVKRANSMGASPRIVGTMALRTALNSGDLLKRVKERSGISLEVISGDEEARLSWKGAVGAFHGEGRLVVFDTGGGSTEFAFGTKSGLERSQSITIGAVTLTERFFLSDPVTKTALNEASEYVRSTFHDNLNKDGLLPEAVIGLGGGVVAMASVKHRLSVFIPTMLDGTVITKGDIDSQLALYASSTMEKRIEIQGLPPRRADIILASACIVQGILEAFNMPSFMVSINGLRHGLLLEMFEM